MRRGAGQLDLRARGPGCGRPCRCLPRPPRAPQLPRPRASASNGTSAARPYVCDPPRPAQRGLVLVASSGSREVEAVPDLELPAADGPALECDRQWIAALVTTWLDEEWLPQEVHRQLGDAAGEAYVRCRRRGDDDVSSLVLGLSSELLSFNFRETFVNAFEVANKVVEAIMLRGGVDVCCVSADDIARVERSLGSSDGSET